MKNLKNKSEETKIRGNIFYIGKDVMNTKATYTLSEVAQYLELKSRIDPSYPKEFNEWYGAEISVPAEVGLGLECENKEIYIHLYNPSVVMTLPLEQAKYFLERQLDAIRDLDPDYTLPYKKITRMELLSLLPS